MSHPSNASHYASLGNHSSWPIILGPMQTPERLVYSVAEAAEVLGVSTAHLYRMVAKGTMPCVRLGNRVVVPIHAIEEMMGAKK